MHKRLYAAPRVFLAAAAAILLAGCSSLSTEAKPKADDIRHELVEAAYADLLESANETEVLVEWAKKQNPDEAKEANLDELPAKIRSAANAMAAAALMADAELGDQAARQALSEGVHP